jgi:hypothetical protein
MSLIERNLVVLVHEGAPIQEVPRVGVDHYLDGTHFEWPEKDLSEQA